MYLDLIEYCTNILHDDNLSTWAGALGKNVLIICSDAWRFSIISTEIIINIRSKYCTSITSIRRESVRSMFAFILSDQIFSSPLKSIFLHNSVHHWCLVTISTTLFKYNDMLENRVWSEHTWNHYHNMILYRATETIIWSAIFSCL